MAKIEVYTTDYCPYCVRAKSLLKNKGVEFKEIEVKTDQERLDLVKKSNGMRTVPQIFINDKHIGGFDDLHKLDLSGELNKMLK